MTRLILLNGPPGIGKSTIARRYADEHPLTLALDLDVVRRMLGAWEAQPLAAGLLARELTLHMARAHLAGGRDVVIPQYLGRPEFLEQAEQAARDSGAEFVEIVLMDSRDDAVQRFLDRTATSTEPGHVEAARMVDAHGGRPTLELMYDRLLLVLNHRPHVRVIQSRHGQADTVYAEVLAALERP